MSSIAEARLGKIARRTVAAGTLAAAGLFVAGGNPVIAEGKPYVQEGSMPSLQDSGIVFDRGVRIQFPDASSAESQSEKSGHSLTRDEVRAIKFVLNKSLNTDVEPGYWSEFNQTLGGESATKYIATNNFVTGNGILPDFHSYGYYPDGKRSEQKQDLLPSLGVGIADPNGAGQESTSVFIDLILGDKGTIKSGVRNPQERSANDFDHFSLSELRGFLKTFTRVPEDATKISARTYSQDGVNAVRRVYKDKEGFRYEQTAMGNGAIELRVDFPKK